MWRFRKYFPDVGRVAVTLGEGETPLVESVVVGRDLGIEKLSFKMESLNPTGSYKDRFAAMAVNDMVHRGVERCLATSSGNTGAALAAYCARAGIPIEIVIVEDAPTGKLAQMLAYGAKLVRVAGFGNDAAVSDAVFAELQRRCEKRGVALQISAFKFSPVGMSGVMTMAFEMIEQSQGDIDHVFCPAGGGGLCLGMIRGFRLFREHGLLEKMPKVHCVQPIGCATMAGPLIEGLDRARAVEGTTAIGGLQVANVVDGNELLPAVKATGGTGFTPTDEAIYGWQEALSRQDGVFAEPAGATALAGAVLAAETGMIQPQEHCVCLVTGVGFKDPESVNRMAPIESIPTMDVESWLGAGMTV